jgi:UDP-N-acetylmuramate--alanine ligase
MRLGFHRVHLIGAGGAGMSAIAKVLTGMGHEVSGSDQRGGATLERLADFGVETYTGHHPEVAAGADLVVASSAVPENDPEMVAAAAAGIPVWRRPELLESLTATVPTIGATGTHGKTTTTAIMVSALRGVGEDPSFIVGGDLAYWNTNGHHGMTDLLVMEVDEAFRTFEHVHLNGLVVTNVEPEHLEHFGTETDLLHSFTEVARSVDGPVLCCADDPGALEVARAVGASTYGVAESAEWRVRNLANVGGGTRFELVGPEVSTHVSLSRPGAHVALDAAGALALLGSMGRDVQTMAMGLASFRGVARRWEHRGTVSGVVLVDDYAHHPTEIEATLRAATEIHPGRVWAVFQPHLYSRTARFHEEFGETLSRADEVVVTDIYGSRELPVPGVTGEMVVEAAKRHGATAHYVPHMADLPRYLAERVGPGDLVLTMGAGDITLVPTELARLLAERSG